MKIVELNKIQMSGKSVSTGKLTGYEVAITEVKKRVYERYSVLIGKTAHDFNVWQPQGAKVESVKRPAFVDKPGVVVAVIGAAFGIEDSRIRTTQELIVEIEV